MYIYNETGKICRHLMDHYDTTTQTQQNHGNRTQELTIHSVENTVAQGSFSVH